MKILFVFKNENFLVPIGACAISAMARREGHEVFLSEMHSENPLERVAKLRPDMVVYSSLSGEAKHYIKLNLQIKECFPEVFTIMGGPHPTFYPNMLHETTLDAVCVGEGEDAFVDLTRALAAGKAVEGIPNIFARKDQAFTIRDLVDDLDSLPFPDFGLFYDNTEMGRYPLKGFITSRGCPYDCTYCFNRAWRKMYEGRGKLRRRHSVAYVIEMIRKVKERWPLSNVKFQDDVFTFQADDWLAEFARRYRKEIGLPFYINTRCDLLDEEMMVLLRDAGCRTISMSIEAGNPSIRADVLNRRMSNEQIVAAHRLCEKHGIYTYTNCIVGLPGTTLADEIQSLDLCLESRVTWAEFPIFHPYPQTKLGDYTISRGMYDADYGRMHTSCLSGSPLNCFTEREKDIQRNFGLLGSVAVTWPWLRGPIVRWLVFWPTNRLFTLLYWLAKTYVVRRKLYETKTGWLESLRIHVRSLKQELFRHSVSDSR